jgi:hypothetical protein
VNPIRLGGIAGFVALATASAWTAAFAHPSDWGPGRPTTFPELVRGLREEVRSIDWALGSRDFRDVDQHASEIAMLLREMPMLAVTLSSALQDSALGSILRAGTRMDAVAAAVRVAARQADPDAVAGQVGRFVEPLAILHAYVPKQYVCSMRCETGKTYDRPLLCPVCNMRLQLVTSDRYSVEVTPASEPVRAGIPAALHFRIKDPAGFDVRALQVVHEKRLHLMIVSHDLSRFDHVHPMPDRDGTFTLLYRFPTGGRYVLFHDFTPDSVGMQVVPVEIAVQGSPPAPVGLVVDDDRPKRIDGYEIALSHTPLTPDAECAMTFTLTRRGKPVSDLEPFLGAMGHLVMISEDRSSYVHSHPLEQTATMGPSVRFAVRFARTGTYKAWGQFQRRGRVLTVPFVVKVASLEDRDTGAWPASGL